MYLFPGLLDDLTLIKNIDAKVKTHKTVSYQLQFLVKNQQLNACLVEIDRKEKNCLLLKNEKLKKRRQSACGLTFLICLQTHCIHGGNLAGGNVT